MRTDRRPEAGHLIPLGVLAGECAAGDETLGERVAPVLDPEPPTRATVHDPRDVARGAEKGIVAAHRGVHGNRPVVELDPGRLRELAVGHDAGGEEHDVGTEPGRAGHAYPPGVLDGLDLGAEDQRHAGLAQPGGDPPPGLHPEPVRLRDGLDADEGHLESAHGQRGSGFAAYEPRADHHRARGAPRALDQALAVGQEPHLEHVLVVGAGHGESVGARAGGEHAGVGGHVLAAGEPNLSPGGVDLLRGGSEAKLDRALGEPARLLERELVASELAAQELLGQRGPLIGEVRLRPDQGHGAVAARVAVPPRGGEAGRSCADDHNVLRRHHRPSKRSRR